MKHNLIEKVVVKKSARRKRTVRARLKNGLMEVTAPLNIDNKQLDKIIENLKQRFEKKEKKDTLNREDRLTERAQKLNKKYFDGKLKLKHIEYSVEQTRSFGICYSKRETIYINGCLKEMPRWVEDYVIIHELAHLIHPNHSKEFWQLVRHYPKTERAIGYLMAKGIEEI